MSKYFFVIARQGFIPIKKTPIDETIDGLERFATELLLSFPSHTITKVEVREDDIWLESAEEFVHLQGLYKEMRETDKALIEQTNAFLREVGLKYGDNFLAALKDCMDESEANEWIPPSIVNQPQGEKQEEDYGAFQHIWVNQTTNGGYSGDDFAGKIYIPLPDGKFVEFSYSM